MPHATITCCRIAASFALVMLLAAMLVACGRAPPEAAIRSQVAALQSAIERRSASDVAELLDEDFIGPQGMDRRAARQMAAALMLRHPADRGDHRPTGGAAAG